MREWRNAGIAQAQAVFDLKYHVIWCAKYRYKILRGKWQSGRAT
jgi:REP element-mobilizing transposase RayT